MKKDEFAKVLDALENSMESVAQEYREHFDKWDGIPARARQLEGYKALQDAHTEAIAIMRREVEPISDAEIQKIWQEYSGGDGGWFTALCFARALLERNK